MSVNGDSTSRAWPEVVWVMAVDNEYESTPTIMSVRMTKSCPRCDEILTVERYEGTGESASESVSRAHDNMTSRFAEHLESCDG